MRKKVLILLIALMSMCALFVFAACEKGETTHTHRYTTEVTMAATCTETGTKIYTCEICGVSYEEVIPVMEHTYGEYVAENEIAATCTEDGVYDSVVYCNVCGVELARETNLISATGHDWNDNVCTICGYDAGGSKGLAWSENSTFYSVSGIGTCTDTKVVIPSTYNGLPVTLIAGWAFGECGGLTSIVIPDSVTDIGFCAFVECSDLISIVIPDSVISIGVQTFAYCTSLTSIIVKEGNTVYHSTGNCLIETASKTLILGCSTSIIPTDGSLISIGDYAFLGCSNLTSITIPNSVTEIGIGAFCDCSSLVNIVIPDSVTEIGVGAFSDCSNLTSVTIGKSVTTIGWHAFLGCSSLTSVTFENTTGWEVAFNTKTISISSSNLSDPETSAELLTSTYCSYDWKRG